MAVFNRNNVGGFQKDSSIFSIFHGTESFLVEDELNESQWNQIERLASQVREQYTSGSLRPFNINTANYNNFFSISSQDGNPMSFFVDGYLLRVGANNPGSLPTGLTSSDDKIIFKLNSAGTQTRTDLLILECWFEVINYTELIRKYGGTDTPNLQNTILDQRSSVETSRRIQFKWRIRAIDGQVDVSQVNAMGYNGIASEIKYQSLGSIYAANIGTKTLSDGSLKSPAIVYAVPLFKVSRPANDSKIKDTDIISLMPKSAISLYAETPTEPNDVATKKYVDEMREYIGEYTSGEVTLKNSDKIAAIGDSLTGNLFSLKDKSYLSKLSLFSDYNWENYAATDETYRDNLDRIRKNIPTYHTTLGWKDFLPKFALLISYINDLKYESYDQYFDNLKAVIQNVRAYGAEPLIATQYNEDLGAGLTVGLKSIAEQYDAKMINILPKTKIFNGKYSPWWNGNNPGTRTNEIMSETIEKFIKNLPRPRQSLKIFRKRDSFTMSVIDDLLFDTNIQRASKWKEISIGHTCLSASSAKYFDDIDGTPALETQKINSEYLKLQNKESISFSNYGLVDAIIPTSARDLKELALNITDPTIQVFAKNIQGTTYEGTVKYQAFSPSSTMPTLTVGDKYTSNIPAFSGIMFTVVGIWNNQIMMTPFNPSITFEYSLSNTLTKFSGNVNSPNTILCAKSFVGFAKEYYDQAFKPEGHWVQIAGDETGKFTITDTKGYVVGDKISFLLYKNNGFSIGDISLSWQGVEHKIYSDKNFTPIEPIGAELLIENKVGNSSQLANWTVVGSLTPSVPFDNILPNNTVGMVEVDSSNYIRQNFAYLSLLNKDIISEPAIIKVWCRVCPSAFDWSTKPYPTDSLITEDTYDYATLGIDLINGSRSFHMEDKVGLHWKEVTIQTMIPSLSSQQSIKVFSKDKKIQIAKVSITLLN
ncbi:hypothetical protein D3C81_559960 [compost metagenome]